MAKLLPLFALLLLAFTSHALNLAPAPDCRPTTQGAPIDGGASLLLASGAAYAVRRLRRSKTK